MSRPVPAALLVLALATAPVLAGCGGDDPATTEGAATTQPATTAPPSTPPATTTSPVPTTPAPDQDDPGAPAPDDTATLEAPGADPEPSAPTIAEVQRPAQPLRCPGKGAKGSPGEEGDFDARELLGLTTAKAEALAQRNDCAMRVVVRDGQDLVRTMDYSSGRVNVTETQGRIVALNGIG
ncbi:I78 family peptidase inhibitor [Patulibacter sp.]|uniref:I78 family peptidase inhibitor n=1 Tax=Patulibacter sp. TaxID=1912859 RepID=UPI0027241489|nr:I78 family peptidase inhibitor [Patulibacter sp.]MDO9408893.1 I78 family peptidase inhibitor [Patulibacter sp.]